MNSLFYLCICIIALLIVILVCICIRLANIQCDVLKILDIVRCIRKDTVRISGADVVFTLAELCQRFSTDTKISEDCK